ARQAGTVEADGRWRFGPCGQFSPVGARSFGLSFTAAILRPKCSEGLIVDRRDLTRQTGLLVRGKGVPKCEQVLLAVGFQLLQEFFARTLHGDGSVHDSDA